MRKPAQTWREKGIDIAAWESNNGFSCTVRKSYKDKTTNEWKESRYYYPDDLERLAVLLVQAMNWVGEYASDKQQNASPNAVSSEVKITNLDDDIPF